MLLGRGVVAEGRVSGTRFEIEPDYAIALSSSTLLCSPHYPSPL